MEEDSRSSSRDRDTWEINRALDDHLLSRSWTETEIRLSGLV